MKQASQPKRFFAARRWVVLHAFEGALFVALGLFNIINVGGWTTWLWGALIAAGPYHFWLAWWLMRQPLIEIHDGVIRQRAVGSSHEAIMTMEEIGALKWSTRSNLCFEHRVKGFFGVTVLSLSRQQRRAVLEVLTSKSLGGAL